MISTLNKFHLILLSLSIIIFANTKEVLASQDWQPVSSNFPATNITGIYASKTSSAIIVSTLRDGLFISNNSGKTWLKVGDIKDSLFSLFASNDKYLIAGGRGAIYKSLDSGKTWTTHILPFKVAVNKIALHPSGKIILGTGSPWDQWGKAQGKGILISGDSAKTWVQANTGIDKTNPLIESLAIASNGNIFAGIADPDAGLNGRFGLYISEDLGNSWKRLSINIKAPFSIEYHDDKLRIGHVLNIAIEDDIVFASIIGIYGNFGFGFTIKSKAGDINKGENSWGIHWVTDSIPLTGSYYHQLTSLYKDSNGYYWSSISTPDNEIFNNIYSSKTLESKAWNFEMAGLQESFGRYIFTEDGKGNLYTTDYISGNQLFVKSIFGPSSINSPDQIAFSIYPLPAKSFLTIKGNFSAPINIRVLDIKGKEILKREDANFNNGTHTMQLPDMIPEGLYLLELSDGTFKSIKSIVLNRD
ncbi:T9SS type A sorting domain-containing protein [Sporocytophaga myxococcoides]|uniref:T9SS type A sorting domain-containing protein n=1 Tax=Sporocytophaga myxococcoides TaxID=153721 RepID=UPI0003F56A4D|nr:T9SS type A sorting domain-containing protein [Sporocytophaga myxococcoides]